MIVGIDLGGTKIEACLFDAGFSPLDRRRVETPTDYAALVAAMGDQVDWLRARAGEPRLPIGVGLPGLVNRKTGLAYTSNLPAMNRPLAADLAARVGVALPFDNDCKCFALSEANGGAGNSARTMFGLILGTGTGGGVCIDRRLATGSNGLPGEVGHIGMPAALLGQLDLPAVRCGCGRMGCYETYLSGRGLSRLCEHLTGTALSGEALAVALTEGSADAERVIAAWSAIAAELIHTLQMTIDPECVVLGGGLTLIPGIAERIQKAFEAIRLAPTRAPAIVIARFGASSGVRGAAMLAMPAEDMEASRR